MGEPLYAYAKSLNRARNLLSSKWFEIELEYNKGYSNLLKCAFSTYLYLKQGFKS